ncbi:MAG TPA: branched-chain amino acid ABC transporter permease [Stellaceae bacterium]|jgi:branched-chain amino acid transport system permease protein|nr:branched-chain amino acid ABC transporter permease [Stellaceae bacterium]
MRRAPALGLSARSAVALGLFIAVMLVLPLVVNDYIVSVLVVVLFAAYFGQSWNIMTGFTGQLSLGHALYVGLGAYTSAALFVHFGLLPWLGIPAGMAVAAIAGGVIAALSFRFRVGGVYFALLTIAFAEFTRILFGHFKWVGATEGLFLPVANLAHQDPLRLRGSPTMFYYFLLALSLGALGLSHLLLNRRIGYYWQAIREDEAAAQSLGINVFRCKVLASALSAAMTALGGGFLAFYDNNLYPDTVFAIGRSVEIITAPIIGGIGTLFGPILGAFLLTTLGETMTSLTSSLEIDGLKQWLYGAALLAIVALQPAGIWPWLRRVLRLEARR